MKRRHFLGLAGLTGLAGVLPGVSFGFPRLDLEAAPDLGAEIQTLFGLWAHIVVAAVDGQEMELPRMWRKP